MNTDSLERIGDFRVHPVASIFPMMTQKESQDLAMSISDLGLQEPVIIHEGLLVDGRNRVKACIATGHPIRTVEWAKIVAHNHQRIGDGSWGDLPATTVDQWIMAKNIARRHLTDDQRTAMWVEYNLWQVAEEAKESQKAAQFEKGKSGNPTGKAAEQVNTKSYSPAEERDRNKTSTVGKVAAAAKVSHHKAEQAVKLVKAVEAGTAPREDLELVKAGLKKLNAAVKPLKAEKPPPSLEEVVLKDLRRLMGKHAVADHPRVISILVAELTKGKPRERE